MRPLNGEAIRVSEFGGPAFLYLVSHELYLALDEEYVSTEEFKDVYEQARRTRAAIYGFIKYLKKYEEDKTTNREP